MQRIVHLVSDPATSGVTATTALLAREMPADLYEHHLVHYGRDGGIAPEFRARAQATHEIPAPPLWAGPFRTSWILLRLKATLRKLSPDLIHAHSFDADLLAVRARPAENIPVLVSCQSFSYVDWVAGHLRQYAVHGRKLDRYVCVCNSLGKDLTALGVVPESSIRVIWNTPRESFFEPISAEERNRSRKALGLSPGDAVLVCVANFDPVKGQDTLAEAFLILVEKHPEAKLIFAGSTLPNPGAVALSMRVRSMLNGRMQSGQVTFLDPCRDVRSVLAAADIYIQPSNSEALSVAIGEAMACGLPVVATSAGGNPEIVIGEHTGILVSPADPPGMSRAVGRLIADQGLRERLGREGHEFARAFLTPRAMLAAYGRIYEELLRPAGISRDAAVSQREGLR